MAGNSVKIRIDGDASGFEKNLSNLTSKTKAGLADIKAGFDLAAAAAKKLFEVGSKGVNYNATIESLKTSFEVMTGSAEKAADVVDRLRVMGAETPFEMIDLASTTQLLMQYGFTADEAIDRMRMLGDIAQGNAQNMNSIALGYAQMSSACKVSLQDIKQMIGAGFNPLQEISERTGESMASLYDRISDGTMTVDEITQSMIHATSEGGRFFQSMEKQSQTLNGQLATLKDNADQLLGSLTEGMSDKLRDEIIPLANNMMAELQGALDSGGYEGLLTKATEMLPGLIDMLTGELQSGIEGLTKWLPKGAKELMKAVPSALKAAAGATPQIVTALFEVSSLILGDLLAMLPELIPVFVEGLMNSFSAAAVGLINGVANIFTGIEQAMHKGQTKIAGMWVDNEQMAKYKFGVEVDVDEEGAATALATGLTNIFTNIQTVLTDGLPDTEEVLKGVEDDVRLWADEAYAQIDAWYKDELEKLNASGLTGAEYDAKLLDIENTYKSMHSSVEAVVTDSLSWMTSMAGKSTRYVKKHLGDLEMIQKEAEETAQKIDEITASVRSKAQQAYDVVRSGAMADEETISLAVNFKWSEFKVDEQAAEDAYAEAVNRLQELYTSGEYTKSTYDVLFKEEEEKLAAAKAAAQNIYQNALREIFSGVADSENILPEIESALSKLDLSESLSGIAMDISEQVPDINAAIGDSLGTELTATLEDRLGAGVENLSYAEIVAELNQWSKELLDEASAEIENTDSEKFSTAYAKALEDGVLEGTVFDAEEPAAQFAAMLGLVIAGGAEKAKPEAKAAGEAVAGSAKDAMSNTGDDGETRGKEFGDGYAEGILSKYSKVYQASRLLAQASSAGTADGQQSASPSKVAAGLGRDFGDGYSMGLQQSMAKAALIARRMTGGISTAADISQNMRVNIPDLSQEIILANEQSQQPVNLFINGKELARVTASDNQTAASWYDRRLAIGRGK